jgi:AraC-like DNA-binding protein
MQHASSLRKAERYIQENFSRKLSLEEIAGVSGFSAPYFSTIFKRETGENLSTYLSRLRVEKASALLISTNLPLNAIANNCGFEDQSWFSKIFKAHTGMSPRRYRKRGGLKGSILPETGFSENYPGLN